MPERSVLRPTSRSGKILIVVQARNQHFAFRLVLDEVFRLFNPRMRGKRLSTYKECKNDMNLPFTAKEFIPGKRVAITIANFA
jgi:hypothetical protein